jgi:hypothetical protein
MGPSNVGQFSFFMIIIGSSSLKKKKLPWFSLVLWYPPKNSSFPKLVWFNKGINLP